MKMFSEIMKSLTEFHNRLVTTHHLHFGNFIVAKIADENVRDKSFAAIAAALASTNVEKAQFKDEPVLTKMGRLVGFQR